MRIAICDDEESQRALIEKYLYAEPYKKQGEK